MAKDVSQDKPQDAATVGTGSPPPGDTGERRRRGRRPADASLRRSAVEAALADLSEARVPFSMGDLAERAGISRATLYRDAGLRDLIGSLGDGPAHRPVNERTHREVRTRAEQLAVELRSLRRQLKALEKRVMDAELRAEKLEKENIRLANVQIMDEALGTGAREKLRAEAYGDGFTAGSRAASQRGGGRGGGGGGAELLAVAQRLPRASIVNARKKLARALHPDLYANDPAASLLATELLKQINALLASSAP